MAEYCEYLLKLRAAKAAWEEYDDPKSLKPLMALIDVVTDPEFLNDKELAEYLLPLLSGVIFKKSLIANERAFDEQLLEYVESSIPKKCLAGRDICTAMPFWTKEILTRWTESRETANYIRTLEHMYKDLVLRWYKARSCDTFQRAIVHMLSDAISEKAKEITWQPEKKMAASEVIGHY